MNGIVDASVAAMWFRPEQYSENAALLLIPEYDLVAPDLIHLEVGSALLKAVRRDEVPITNSVEVLSALLPAAIRMLPAADRRLATVAGEAKVRATLIADGPPALAD